MIITRQKKLLFIKKAYYDKETGCLIWGASLDSSGYPQATIGRGNLVRVHRVLLERKLGIILNSDEFANHHCNNRQCISTADGHVYKGNKSQNTSDSVDRGTFNYPHSWKKRII
jgi:hypothetical protein